MPIWPVSFVEGSFQVADADGEFYPITLQGTPVTSFNPGWSPRGLQTGLAPFHILELDHEAGLTTIWLLDAALDFRANSVVNLGTEDRTQFFAHLDPLVRALFEHTVRAPDPIIPASTHEFDGFLPASIGVLIDEAIARTAGTPKLVLIDSLGPDGVYAQHDITLPAGWIEHALSPSTPAQTRMELPDHTVFRHVDDETGLVSYLLEGAVAGEHDLYVPAVSALFSRRPEGHDPARLLNQLMVCYASGGGRVPDPLMPKPQEPDPLEPALIDPGLIDPVAPPQHGLDEPPLPRDSGGGIHPPSQPEQMMPVLSSQSQPDPLPAATVVPFPADGGPTLDQSGGRVGGAFSRPAQRQSWWQRLLGMGNA